VAEKMHFRDTTTTKDSIWLKHEKGKRKKKEERRKKKGERRKKKEERRK
jgi:hypothetical protein